MCRLSKMLCTVCNAYLANGVPTNLQKHKHMPTVLLSIRACHQLHAAFCIDMLMQSAYASSCVLCMSGGYYMKPADLEPMSRLKIVHLYANHQLLHPKHITARS